MNTIMHKLLLVIIGFLPFIALLITSYRTVKKKKQNESILINIIIMTFLFVFIAFPLVCYFDDTEGISFFIAIIMEYYVISMLIPWSSLIFISSFLIKKNKRNPSKVKTTLSIIFVLLLTIMVCIGTFSGIFFDLTNELIGGPKVVG